jgi:hypothetical protein
MFTLGIKSPVEADDVFESMQKLSCIGTPANVWTTCVEKIEHCFAFYYQPTPPIPQDDGWKLYNVVNEFTRMGIGISTEGWRFTNVNEEYKLCPTYPTTLVVPTKISDPSLWHAAKFRSKGRIPVLTYYYADTKALFSLLL